jgi:hypothetical protein
MPRVYDSANNPHDFCEGCFPDLAEAHEEFGVEVCGEGPDGRGDCFEHQADHPPYAGENYRCEHCNKRLTEEDD